jgi:hypothetical protein
VQPDEQAHALSHEALAEIGPTTNSPACDLVLVAAFSGCDLAVFQIDDGTSPSST